MVKIQNLVSILLLIFLSSSMVYASQPKVVLSTDKVDLGAVNHPEVAYGSFDITNAGDEVLVIEEIGATCGCTVTDYLSGELAPGEKVTIHFQVFSRGKSGNIRKGIKISTNDPDNRKIWVYAHLNVKLQEHQQMDHSAVFKGECGTCHAQPAKNLMDEALFEAVCFMCHGHHGLGGLAKELNDFEYVSQHDEEYFRTIISSGMENTSMPAFSKQHGGPLNEAQIESLVQLIIWWREGFVFRKNEAKLKFLTNQ
jgi:cytochrome c553